MTLSDIVHYRLINQQIAETKFKQPHEIVAWMGAMQAQDFAMAKWAIGLRLHKLNDHDVEQAFNEGTILRTHLMRPTWHFVTPADIRWMLALTAPRVNAWNASMYRKCELDGMIFKRTNEILAKALRDGKYLTRAALKTILERKKITGDVVRLSLIMMRAELDGLICSGPRQGKQFTYALLDERVSKTKPFSKEEALGELTRRYFTSRGPATVQDFAWWSGLTMKDASAGVSILGSGFEHESLDGRGYWFLPIASARRRKLQTTFLLPDYDEYGISYKNRNAIYDAEKVRGEKRNGNPLFNHMIVVDGIIGGTWNRTITNNTLHIETRSFTPLTRASQTAIDDAVKRYASFTKALFKKIEHRGKK